MFDIEHFTLSSDANNDRWIKFVHEGLANGGKFLLVAKSGNRLAEFAFASVRRDYPLDVAEFAGSLDDVYVLPRFRGSGIGKRLVAQCLKKMKAKGVHTVRLTVLAENKTTTKLYERLGFRIYTYQMITRL
jgi:ribosomal protein S18 acetylase RimI-like enzyme